MQALTFKRGVHPDDCKRFSADKPIEVILPKENSEMFYPMSQHIGAPCEPIVAVGDYVKAGQKIAETGAFVSSPIFSSVDVYKRQLLRNVFTGKGKRRMGNY